MGALEVIIEGEVLDCRDDNACRTVPSKKNALRCDVMTDADRAAERLTTWTRRRAADFTGTALFLAYVLTTVGYAYVRATRSLADLGPLYAYGAFVLFVEMLGALSIMFYGVWLTARPIASDPAAADGLRRGYSIRVLVPCYKESLAIVRRTVLAALNARLPDGCSSTVYLCDDGKDLDKRDWISSLRRDDAVYVTGRPRTGQTNGKSENLNYALRLIYPKTGDIPINEVVALFDADQTCSETIFERLLTYLDSGDDVAVALSPQLMHNVSRDCDIFNHQNVHFWEKMQLGMDAYGFISLTGTNMLLRSRALRDCDWFPTKTVTEDWELGMRMKKRGWKCRYATEYLAIGEAPHDVRVAFQQRSRWCKGHFQTFWSEECPLTDGQLTMFNRLAYSSSCLSYMTSGISVPVMTAVPIVTLLVGYFPITLDFWTVSAITAYYVSMNALTYYCASASHMKALWLSNVATTIMFWAYLKAAILTPPKAVWKRGVTFKATKKGGGAASNAALKELWPSLAITGTSVASLVLGLVGFSVDANAPRAIALCWVVYNTVPHILLIAYAHVGQGPSLTLLCKACMFLSFFASSFALVLMWLLYPRDTDYGRAATLSLEFLQAQRSGPLPAGYDVPWRHPAGSGGFYSDGVVGPVRLTASVARTTSMLAWSLLDVPEYWASDLGARNDALDLLKCGSDFVDASYENNGSAPLSIVYMIGDLQAERATWRRPEDVPEPIPVMSVQCADGPSDLAGQVVAAMVSSSLAAVSYDTTDLSTAASRIDAAHDLFAHSMNNPGKYTDLAGVLETKLADYFPSNSYYDDLFWAATWLFRAALAGYRRADMMYYANAMDVLMDLAFGEQDVLAVSYDYMPNAAVVHAASITKSHKFHSAARSFLWDWTCSGEATTTARGRGYYDKSPYLGDSMAVAALAAVYARNSAGFASGAEKEGYYCFAETQGRYALGAGRYAPYMVGFSAKGPTKTWHRGAVCPAWPEPCDAGAAFAGEPDANLLNGALLWAPTAKDGFPRSRGGNATVVSLENNWALPLLFPALEAKKTPYVRCLQGAGALRGQALCRSGRPNELRMGPMDVSQPSMPEFAGLYDKRA
jgi:cellulose synthase/poly-beta-1,6-N-acetylglucosamine synthase-like glycosyltransferase